MRDLRDPQSLGEAYLKARAAGLDISVACQLPAPRTNENPSCVEKYGRPDEVQPKWMEVQVR